VESSDRWNMEALRLRRYRLELRSMVFPAAVARAFDALSEWRRRGRERRYLSSLSDAMLKDIGISRADAWAEYEKPFWHP